MDGEQAAIQRDGDDLVLRQRGAAIVDAAAGDVTSPHLVDARVHLPDEVGARAAAQVELVERAPAVGDIDVAVLGERRAFEARHALAAALGTRLAGEQDHRCKLEVADVAGVDLIRLPKAVTGVVLVMMQPVVGLGIGVDEARIGHVARRRRMREGTGGDHRRADEFLRRHVLPRLIMPNSQCAVGAQPEGCSLAFQQAAL